MAGVLQRADAIHREVINGNASLRPPWKRKAADWKTDGVENLNALGSARGIGDDERAVGGDGKRGGVDDAARLGADPDDLPGAGLRLVDAEHGVGAPIENEVLSGRGLLKAGGLSKTSGDVGGNRAGRLENLELQACERRQSRDNGSDGENSLSHDMNGGSKRTRPSCRPGPFGPGACL
jgi:hypothetical protein